MKINVSVPNYAFVVLKSFSLSTGRSVEEVCSALLISCAKNIKDKRVVSSDK